MKILLTHRFYWPDTSPYGLILREIARDLSASGHDVTIFSTVPTYRSNEKAPYTQKDGSIKIYRIPVVKDEKRHFSFRLFNMMIYCFGLMIMILRHRPDYVSAATYPPIAAPLCASSMCRLIGAKFVYHIQDIYPEILEIRNRKPVFRLLLRIAKLVDNLSIRNSSVIVTLSTDMSNTLRRRMASLPPIVIIPNPAISEPEKGITIPPQFLKQRGRIRAIFAGNLGSHQNLDVLVEGVSGCFDKYPALELVLMGEGDKKTALEEKWGSDPRITFFPFLDGPIAKQLIRESDIALVSLNGDLYRYAYPSKIATYIDIGVPIFALVEKHSEIAKNIGGTSNGCVPECMTPDSITVSLDGFLELISRNENLRSSYVACGQRSVTWPELIDKYA